MIVATEKLNVFISTLTVEVDKALNNIFIENTFQTFLVYSIPIVRIKSTRRLKVIHYYH